MDDQCGFSADRVIFYFFIYFSVCMYLCPYGIVSMDLV